MVGARFGARIALGIWCGSVLSACNAFDASALESLQSPIQRPVRDAGHGDAAAAPDCVVTSVFENCNGLDDDCNGSVDEGADVACVTLNALTACTSSGHCVTLACKPGYLDCNDTKEDGCEHPEEEGPCPSCDGEVCIDDAGMDAGPEPVEDAEVEDAAPEAEVPPEDACVEHAETCDGEDNDCDDHVDETTECAIERCVATVPSYRGEECDRCVCEKCGAYTDDCQDNSNATWVTQCRAVLECYVVEERAGNCNGSDCYGVGGGPCAAEINIAAGGTSETDTSAAVGGGCTATDPPTTACMAAANYRDHCTLDLCADECAD